VRQALTTLVFLLPPSRLKVTLLNRLGHDVHPTARIGICLVQRVERFALAEGVLINHFNVFRDLALVQLGRGSRIFMLNWILGDSGFEPGMSEGENRRTLRMGSYSHIISHHYLDCGAGLLLGDTHAFDPVAGTMLLEPVTLEDGAVVATCCTLLPGTVVGAGALVGAGSTTWTGQQVVAETLSGGVPARRLTPITISPEAYNRARFDG
jgi:acetyltransferase-like isoleucine patch superfamily enzyme